MTTLTLLFPFSSTYYPGHSVPKHPLQLLFT